MIEHIIPILVRLILEQLSVTPDSRRPVTGSSDHERIRIASLVEEFKDVSDIIKGAVHLPYCLPPYSEPVHLLLQHTLALVLHPHQLRARLA